MILPIHTIFSSIALIAGAIIFIRPKGTPLHRKLGYAYNISMVGLIVTSFWIFELFEGFGVYHALSIVSLVTLAIGMYYPLFGRAKDSWFGYHYVWMAYSYIGLIMAGGSHLFQYFPDWPVWFRAALFWGLPYVGGSILVFSNKKKLMASVSARIQKG